VLSIDEFQNLVNWCQTKLEEHNKTNRRIRSNDAYESVRTVREQYSQENGYINHEIFNNAIKLAITNLMVNPMSFTFRRFISGYSKIEYDYQSTYAFRTQESIAYFGNIINRFNDLYDFVEDVISKEIQYNPSTLNTGSYLYTVRLLIKIVNIPYIILENYIQLQIGNILLHIKKVAVPSATIDDVKLYQHDMCSLIINQLCNTDETISMDRQSKYMFKSIDSIVESLINSTMTDRQKDIYEIYLMACKSSIIEVISKIILTILSHMLNMLMVGYDYDKIESIVKCIYACTLSLNYFGLPQVDE
jgi:hypothetical protein